MDSNQSRLEFSGGQVIFCRDCIVINAREAKGDFHEMTRPNPAVTWQVVLENNMPVAVPVCLGHVYWKETSLTTL